MLLRPLNPATDFPRIAELTNMVEPEPVTADMLLRRQRLAPPERIAHRIVALDDDEHIVGFSSIVRNPWLQGGQFWFRVIVDIALRNRGYGSALYAADLAFTREQGATHLLSEVRESCAGCLRFAQKRGFAIERRMFVSRLYLDSFDESRFAGTVERVEATGIRFLTLAQAGNTDENRRRLYELNRRVAGDNPAYEGWSFPSFEVYSQRMTASPQFSADNMFIAADGGTWIGMADVDYYPQTNSLHNGFTGIERAYRGRDIALVLKLLTIHYARQRGIAYLYTNNDSTNAPMLAINRKLGYQAEPGILMLARAL